MSKHINDKKNEKNNDLGIVRCTVLFCFMCGAESDAEGTENDSTVVVIDTVVTSYTVDTATTVINWMTYDGEEIAHQGTVAALSGSFEITVIGEEASITGGDLVVNMNSIAEGDEKLEGHLKTPDFFDVMQFPTTSFAFDRHENGMIYGTATIIGKEVAIEAPVELTVAEGTAVVTVGEFTVDFAALEMMFFEREKTEAKPEEMHSTSIGFSATVNGSAAQ